MLGTRDRTLSFPRSLDASSVCVVSRVSLAKRRRRAPTEMKPGKVTREEKPQSFAAALYIFAATPSSQSTCVCVTGHKSECWSAWSW